MVIDYLWKKAWRERWAGFLDFVNRIGILLLQSCEGPTPTKIVKEYDHIVKTFFHKTKLEKASDQAETIPEHLTRPHQVKE